VGRRADLAFSDYLVRQGLRKEVEVWEVHSASVFRKKRIKMSFSEGCFLPLILNPCQYRFLASEAT